VNVLFLCTGNSCRSLISEAVFNHLAPRGWHAISAGSQPTGKLNDRALALLAGKGISTEGYYSKSWDALPVTPDIVVTVCASAAGEACPAYLGPVLRTHWGVDDPSHVTGSEAQIGAAFEHAYAILRARIDAFIALPLDALKADRAQLKLALDGIGRIGRPGT
jgi:arsenate reductase